MTFHNCVTFAAGFVIPFALTYLIFAFPYGNAAPAWNPLAFGIGSGVIAVFAITLAFNIAWPKD